MKLEVLIWQVLDGLITQKEPFHGDIIRKVFKFPSSDWWRAPWRAQSWKHQFEKRLKYADCHKKYGCGAWGLVTKNNLDGINSKCTQFTECSDCSDGEEIIRKGKTFIEGMDARTKKGPVWPSLSWGEGLYGVAFTRTARIIMNKVSISRLSGSSVSI